MEAVERMTGQTPQRLIDALPVPVGCIQLWADFLDMHGCRGSNGFGPSRITFMDIDAWQRVNGARLTAWELESIRRADNAYLASLPKPKEAGE